MKRSNSLPFVSCAKKDPSDWSPEVIRALCQRLPGSAPVTTQCGACGSVFYPCLCSSAEADHKNQNRLQAPRIIKAAESRRLGREPGKLGHLGMVKFAVEEPGMDKDRLQVVRPDFGGGHDKLRRKAQSQKQGHVLKRIDSQYILRIDDAPKWVQELTLTPKELGDLIHKGLDESLHSLGDRAIITLTVCYPDEDSAMGDFELVAAPSIDPGKSGVQRKAAPGHHDDSSGEEEAEEDTFYVRKVKKHGPAYKAGIRKGQILASLQGLDSCCALGATSSDGNEDFGWKKLPWSLLPGPFVHVQENDSRVAETGASKRMAAGWLRPFRVKINPLPYGWRAVQHVAGGPLCTGDAARLSHRKLLELSKQPENVVLRFERTPVEIVSRTEMLVRHRRVWETGPRKGKKVRARQADADLLLDWSVRSHLTKAQLHFIFNKLISTLQDEMRIIEHEKATYESLLLGKAEKALGVENALKLQPEIKSLERMKLEKSLEFEKRNIAILCKEVPTNFLQELVDACAAICDQRRRESSSCTTFKDLSAMLKATDSWENPTDLSHDVGVEAIRKRLLRVSTQSEVGGVSSPVAGCESPSFGVDSIEEREKLRASLVILKEQAVKVLEAHDKGKKARDVPGRVDFGRFKKVIVQTGASWLSEEDLRHKFTTMDSDGNGYLTLNEVLDTALRMADLLRQLDDFQKEDTKGDSKSELELLERFTLRLLLGDDLVGPCTAKVIPTRCITASSYYRNRPDHGKGQMDRSRLDFDGTPWMADCQDTEPWIEWDLGEPRVVTAVLIRGNPRQHLRSWVTHFRLEWQAPESDKWEKGEEDLEASIDRDTTVMRRLAQPLKACKVRLYPTSWVPTDRGPSLRATLLGFFSPDEVPEFGTGTQ